jgi:hypothetical protein
VVENCVECSKIGATTECEYMEFPEGMHHYFDEKVCSFHHWFLYVRPRMGWEKYLARAGGGAGYHLTLPSDEVMKAIIRGDVPPAAGPVGGTQAPDSGQDQQVNSSKEQATPQSTPSEP